MKPAVYLNLMFNRAPDRIAKAMLRRVDVEIITRSPSLDILREAGIPCQPLDDYFSSQDVDLLAPELCWRLQAFEEALALPAFREAYSWMDDATFEDARARLLATGREQIPVGMCEAVMIRRCVESVDLRLIVLSEDHLTHTRAYVSQARMLGIPSMVIAHAIPVGCPSPMPNVDVDRVACFGALTADRYKQVGATANQIVITGNPAWDLYAGPPPPQMRATTRNDLGIGPEDKVVVYATTSAGRWSTSLCRVPAIHKDHAAVAAEAFVACVRRHPDWHFGLRPRLDDQDIMFAIDLLEVIRKAGGRVFLDRLHPYSSVVNADLLISTESNFLVEALLLDRYAINLRLPGSHSMPYTEGLGPLFDSEDAVPTVSSAGDLAEAIESMLCGGGAAEAYRQRRNRTISKFNCPNDGKATERVVDVAMSLMGLDPAMRRPLDEQELMADEAIREGEERFLVGDRQGALASFSRAVQLRRDHPVALNNLATALHATGFPDKAWGFVIEALHRDPCLEVARDNLTALGEFLGYQNEARALLDAYPGNRDGVCL